jgi:predicted transcriptional regulator of viral defense system
MNIHEFKNEFGKMICFTPNQVLTMQPKFNKNNLTNWLQKGYILKLKNGFYTFPEYLSKPNFNFYFANRIYRPSYISTHSALAFYGLIPEAVLQVTCVSSLKTKSFNTVFGSFHYQSINPKYFFGYAQKPLQSGLNIFLASPEKAILDTLYLNSYYTEAKDLEELRLDNDTFSECMDIAKLLEYSNRFKNKRLSFLTGILIENMS